MASAAALSYLAAGFVGAAILVYFVLKSTHAWNLLTSANARSLHGSATPTAGGIGFAIPVIVYLYLLVEEGVASAGGLLIGCSALAAVTLWDDLKGLNPSFRLACQVVVVAVVAWSLQPPSTDSQWHWLVTLGVGAAMLWHVHLFTFMDGVDGMAAVQCLFFCTGVQVLTLGIPGWVGDLTWLLAGAALGFLIYNWPPAKIFMGSVGSAFLGLLLAVLSLQLWHSEQLPLATCLILLAGFWFNATYEVCVRMLSGQGFTQACLCNPPRRCHLYQRMAERKGQVWTVVAYVVFSVCWLMPLSWLTLLYAQLDLLWLVLAVLPMGIAARILNAGMPTPDEG